jgi:signal peptidase II
VAVTAYAVDLGSKQWAVEALADRDIPVIGDLLVLHLVFNPGAAFSTGTQFTIVFTVLAFVAVGVVLWLSRRVASTLWAVGLGFLLGGVAGNLTDRLFRPPGDFRGHVVDFLMLPNWPVFNVADICINAAAVAIIVQSIRGVSLDGSRADRDTDRDTGQDTGQDTAPGNNDPGEAPGAPREAIS